MLLKVIRFINLDIKKLLYFFTHLDHREIPKNENIITMTEAILKFMHTFFLRFRKIQLISNLT